MIAARATRRLVRVLLAFGEEAETGRSALQRAAEHYDLHISHRPTLEHLRTALVEGDWDFLLCSSREGVPWRALLPHADELAPGVPVIALAEDEDADELEQLVRAGAAIVISRKNADLIVAYMTRRLAEARKQAMQELRIAAESSPDPTLIVDGEGCIVYANALAEELLGYRREELGGWPVETLLPERLRGRHRKERIAYMRAPAPRPMGTGRELVVAHRSGGEIPVEVSLGPLRIGGEHYVVTGLRDLRERRRTDMLLRAILEGTAKAKGADFLHALVARLGETLGARGSLVAELESARARELRVLAAWQSGKGAIAAKPLPLSGPWRSTLERGGCALAAAELAAAEGDDPLALRRAQAYFGLRLDDSEGRAVGLLAAWYDRPAVPPTDETVIRIFAARAGAELEQLRTLRRLRQSEAKLRDLLELSTDWYWEQDEQFRFLDTEDQPSGLRPERVGGYVGRTRWELHRESLAPEAWEAHRRDLEAHREFRDFVYRRRGRDGKLRWVSVSGRPVYDARGRFRGYHGVARDITAAKEANEKLLAQRAELQLLIDLVPGFVTRYDRDFRVEFANQRYRDFFGRGAEVVGRTAAEIFGPAIWSEVRPHFERARKGETVRYEAARRAPTGELRRLQVTLVPQPASEPVEKIYTLGVDVSELVEAREALARLNAELERRVEERTAELRAALAEMEAFSTSVSHDLRAPLRAIAGFAALVREELGAALSGEAARLFARIESNAVRMAEMIDALLALARFGRQPLERVPLDMHAVARDVVEELRAAGALGAARVQIEVLPPAQGDRALVRQVLANLIANAAKYSAPKPEPRIWIESQGEPGRVVYIVRDNGVGFDMRYAEKLFGIFERLHAPAEFPGLGIGLATVRRIVERHGGRVWAEAEPGRGATFFFTLEPTAA